MNHGETAEAVHLRERVQLVLDDFLAAQRVTLGEVAPQCLPLLDSIAILLRGGKRLRASFCYWGWRGVRGDEPAEPGAELESERTETAVVRAAAALELFQAAALIHDDVMDASDVRRGLPATHRQFAMLHQRSAWCGDADRFGMAGAILSGDLCLAWSDEMLNGAPIPADAVAGVRRIFDTMRTQLMGGQYLDMIAEVKPLLAVPGVVSGPSADEVADLLDLARRVICFKSAKYTIEHPLLLGAAIAQAPAATSAAYSAFGLPLGEAFQLRDDVLGVFGDPSETGKPAGDDLREGKRTVLVVLALQRASPAQVAVLNRLLGDPSLDDAGVAALRDVVLETGALQRVEAMIAEQVARARSALAAAPIHPPARAALDQLIQAATARVA